MRELSVRILYRLGTALKVLSNPILLTSGCEIVSANFMMDGNRKKSQYFFYLCANHFAIFIYGKAFLSVEPFKRVQSLNSIHVYVCWYDLAHAF
jgi:hypothetical protein